MKKFDCVVIGVLLFLTATCCPSCANDRSKTDTRTAFYNLDQAYSRGLLSQNDLRNIAYYYGQTVCGYQPEEGFAPSPKVPETLDETTKNKICSDYYFSSDKEVPIGHYYVAKYYGTYHGCVAVEISDTYYICHEPIFVEGFSVGGVYIGDYASGILIWLSDDCTP